MPNALTFVDSHKAGAKSSATPKQRVEAKASKKHGTSYVFRVPVTLNQHISHLTAHKHVLICTDIKAATTDFYKLSTYYSLLFERNM